jgi:hypothetical protein
MLVVIIVALVIGGVVYLQVKKNPTLLAVEHTVLGWLKTLGQKLKIIK